MKTITCIDCDRQFSGQSAEAIMEDMMMHYLNDHGDIMDAATEELPDGWFIEFNDRYDSAPET